MNAKQARTPGPWRMDHSGAFPLIQRDDGFCLETVGKRAKELPRIAAILNSHDALVAALQITIAELEHTNSNVGTRAEVAHLARAVLAAAAKAEA